MDPALWDKVIFGSYTVKDLAIYVGGFFAFVVLWSFVRKLFVGKPENPHVQRLRCTNCGWQGEVSRYKANCPQCNTPLVDRRNPSA